MLFNVLTLHNIAITLLSLRLDVSSVGILDSIVEGVLGIGHRLGVNGVRQNRRMMHQRRSIVSQLNGNGLSGGDQHSDGNKVLEGGEVTIRIGIFTWGFRCRTRWVGGFFGGLWDKHTPSFCGLKTLTTTDTRRERRTMIPVQEEAVRIARVSEDR